MHILHQHTVSAPIYTPLHVQVTHKYVVQARILRKSWPLAETAWPHIAAITRMDERVNSGQKPGSGKKSKIKDRRKTQSTVQSPNMDRVQVGNVFCTGKSGITNYYYASIYTSNTLQQFDASKPHWVLRVVTNSVSHIFNTV